MVYIKSGSLIDIIYEYTSPLFTQPIIYWSPIPKVPERYHAYAIDNTLGVYHQTPRNNRKIKGGKDINIGGVPSSFHTPSCIRQSNALVTGSKKQKILTLNT